MTPAEIRALRTTLGRWMLAALYRAKGFIREAAFAACPGEAEAFGYAWIDLGDAAVCAAARRALASQSAEILSLRERVRDLRDGAIRRVQTGVSEIRRDLNGIIEERDADIGRLTARVAELEVLLSAAEGNAEAFLDARATAAILDDRVSALEGDRDAAIARARTLTLDTSTTSLEAVCSMADRISELEDTVDLERARYCVSPGCDKECGVCRPYLAAIAEIEARRGASWKGAR